MIRVLLVRIGSGQNESGIIMRMYLGGPEEKTGNCKQEQLEFLTINHIDLLVENYQVEKLIPGELGALGDIFYTGTQNGSKLEV
jgi:hypothetical protein